MRRTIMAMAVAAGFFSYGNVVQSAQAQDFRTVYSFTVPRHGASSLYNGFLTAYRGRLFEVSNLQHTEACHTIYGTVFAINPQLDRRKLEYCFQGGFAGSDPRPGFAVVDDLLYGASEGGHYDNGGIYSLNPKTGAFTFVYSFTQSVGNSNGGLIASGNTIYGSTTSDTSPGGNIFSLNISTHVLQILYTFQYPYSNGASPVPGLIYENGLIYGSTESGGTTNSGVVFSVDPATGVEKVLHSFGSGDDGNVPTGPLKKIGNKLYGTTSSGGTSNLGTIFTVDLLTGNEKVVHSFGGSPDGASPEYGLTYVRGKLYGATLGGGTGFCDGAGGGCGTIFSLDLASMEESLVYNFQGGDGGRGPITLLTDVHGTLYGATFGDGAYGGGTVFAFTP